VSTPLALRFPGATRRAPTGAPADLGDWATASFAVAVLTVVCLQGIAFAADGDLRAVTSGAAWLLAAWAVVVASALAALRIGWSRVGAAWLLWSLAAGLWAAGSAVRITAPALSTPSAADGLWWAFGAVSLVAVILRAPSGLPAFRVFFLDALPLVALAGLGIQLVGGDVPGRPLGTEIAEGVYAGLFTLLALSVLQFITLPGRRPAGASTTYHLRAFFGASWLLFAVASFVWAWSALEGSEPVDHWSSAIWTAGFLMLAGWAWLRSLRPAGMGTYARPMDESGWRALLPVLGVVGLLAIELLELTTGDVADWFLVAGLVALASRFYLLRRETGQSQAALRESEQRFRSVFSSAAVGIVLTARDGQVLESNGGLERMLGYEPGGLAGARASELTHPGDLAESERLWDELNCGQRDSFVQEKRYRTRGGAHLWGRVTTSLVHDERREPRFVVAVVENIDVQKRADELFRHRDAVLAAVASCANRLLHAPDWSDVIRDVLGTLVEAADVSRAYVFRRHGGDNGELRVTRLHEWAAPGVSPEAENPQLVGRRPVGIEKEWMTDLEQNRIVQGHAGDADPVFRALLEEQQIESLILVPIFVQGEWWGYLGFDDCVRGREWQAVEMEALRAAADMLGAAIERRRVQERYRTLVEQLPLVTYIDALDDRSSNIYTSPQLETLLGYTVEEWQADPDLFVRLLHPDDRERVLAEVAYSHATDEPFVSEYRLIARDGRVVWFRDEAVTVHDELRNPMQAQGYLLDITARKLAEEELRDSEERFRTLIENIPGAVYRCAVDAQWTMELLSDDIEEITGYPVSDFVGNAVRTFASIVHPDDLERLGQLVDEGVRERRAFVCDYRLVRADGEVRWVYEQGQPVFGPDGQPAWLDGVIIDVSRRKLMEQERESLLAALEKQNEQLRALDRLKDEFVALVSHELRTPLTSIIGYLDLVLDGEGGPLTAEQVGFLEVIRRNSDRLIRLVGDLLFVAQVDAGKLSIERVPVDLEQLARDCIEAARPRASDKEVELRLKARKAGPIEGDRVRLAQLLDNLVSNAIKFTPAGGRVDVAVIRRNDRVVVTVADTGIGIAEQEQRRLFERFFRSETVARLAIQGTGLGLTIAKAIAEAHGGRITVRSAEGAGTTFEVDLPRRA
jgi:PAS domain S-box-containing protein